MPALQQTFAACDDFVGRAPRPAVDPLVDLLDRRKSRTRGSGADEGVRPTFWWRLAAMWGRLAIGPPTVLTRNTLTSQHLRPQPSTSIVIWEAYDPFLSGQIGSTTNTGFVSGGRTEMPTTWRLSTITRRCCDGNSEIK